MKLTELKPLNESYDSHMIVKAWDGHQPDKMIVKPFDVYVEYHVQNLGHSYHPYGEGSAREEHGVSVVVSAVSSNEVVEVLDEEGEKVLKTFPKGTPLENIPGWDKSSMDWFTEQAQEEAAE